MQSARKHRFACIACLALLTAPPIGAAPPPAEAFASLPNISDVDLSPNGQLIAFADRSGQLERVIVVDLATGNTRTQFNIDAGMKLRDLAWSDDETVLIEVSQTDKQTDDKVEFFRTLAADVNTGKAKVLLMAGGSRSYVAASSVLARHTGKPRKVVMSSWDWLASAARLEADTRLKGGHRNDSGWVATVFEVDTETGKVEQR